MGFPVVHATSTFQPKVEVMNPVTDYAKIVDEPGVTVLSAKNAALDTNELITYRYSDVKKVSTSAENLNPPNVRSGVQYVVKVETFYRIEDSTSKSGHTDLPLVGYLTLRHPRHSAITDDVLTSLVGEVIGASYSETDKKYRFSKLAKGAVNPEVD